MNAGRGFAQGAQFALGKRRLPSCRRCHAASRPSLLALPKRSVTSAHHCGSFITVWEPECWRLPQTPLVSWTATLATSSLIPLLPKTASDCPWLAATRYRTASTALTTRCAEQGHTPRSSDRRSTALTVILLKTLALLSLAPSDRSYVRSKHYAGRCMGTPRAIRLPIATKPESCGRRSICVIPGIRIPRLRHSSIRLRH